MNLEALQWFAISLLGFMVSALGFSLYFLGRKR